VSFWGGREAGDPSDRDWCECVDNSRSTWGGRDGKTSWCGAREDDDGELLLI
jgi:hypothetical protein